MDGWYKPCYWNMEELNKKMGSISLKIKIIKFIDLMSADSFIKQNCFTPTKSFSTTVLQLTNIISPVHIVIRSITSTRAAARGKTEEEWSVADVLRDTVWSRHTRKLRKNITKQPCVLGMENRIQKITRVSQ